jgi:spore protease
MNEFKARTDLAVELKEDISEEDSALHGIIVEEQEPLSNIHVTKLRVVNDRGAKLLHKPVGTYITLEAPDMACGDEGYHREISEVLSEYLYELLLPYKKEGKLSILVAGLGNREVTPDALGPNVAANMDIGAGIKCIAPGVMAQTGMETAQIIRGIVSVEKPSVLLAIDALAARSTKRLNTTIQLANTGIQPGSGVGNHRSAITEENIGVPVVALGVPTVIDAPAIVNDTLDNLLAVLNAKNTVEEFSHDEKYRLIKEIINPDIAEMFVTPKDADETIRRIGYTISEAINIVASMGI